MCAHLEPDRLHLGLDQCFRHLLAQFVETSEGHFVCMTIVAVPQVLLRLVKRAIALPVAVRLHQHQHQLKLRLQDPLQAGAVLAGRAVWFQRTSTHGG